MKLTAEVPLPFQGLNGYAGLAHVRIFEEPGQRPVAIAGQLQDAPGTMINNGIETVAEAIRRAFFPDGPEFELITYLPGAWPYSKVSFDIGQMADDPFDPAHYTGQAIITDGTRQANVMGAEKAGSFRNPRWQRIEDIASVLGSVPQEWHPDDYTVAAVFGAQGERICADVAAATVEQTQRWSSALGES